MKKVTACHRRRSGPICSIRYIRFVCVQCLNCVELQTAQTDHAEAPRQCGTFPHSSGYLNRLRTTVLLSCPHQVLPPGDKLSCKSMRATKS